MLFDILIILVLILANALFAAAETSLIAARKGRLEQRAAEGRGGGRRPGGEDVAGGAAVGAYARCPRTVASSKAALGNAHRPAGR